MNKKNFTKKIYILIACFVLVTFSAPLGIYIASSDWKLGGFVLLTALALDALSYLMYQLSDRYITEIVAELSKLLDVLTQLSEEEVFPDNEDTLVSKLQNKVLRLVSILRKNNERTKQEQENIQSLVSDISHQLKTPISNLKMYRGIEIIYQEKSKIMIHHDKNWTAEAIFNLLDNAVKYGKKAVISSSP